MRAKAPPEKTKKKCSSRRKYIEEHHINLRSPKVVRGPQSNTPSTACSLLISSMYSITSSSRSKGENQKVDIQISNRTNLLNSGVNTNGDDQLQNLALAAHFHIQVEVGAHYVQKCHFYQL